VASHVTHVDWGETTTIEVHAYVAANVDEHDTTTRTGYGDQTQRIPSQPYGTLGNFRSQPNLCVYSQGATSFISKVPPAKVSVVDQGDKQCNKHFRVRRDIACVASLFGLGKLVGKCRVWDR
jgi:hypothetical protein